MEIYTKYDIRDGQLAAFRDRAGAIAEAARAGGIAQRCDWFVREASGTGVHMLALRDEAALGAYRAATQSLYDAIAATATATGANMEILGSVSAAFRASITRHGTQQLDFGGGLGGGSGASGFSPAGSGSTDHIEIYTRFRIHPGKLEEFKRDATALLAVVKASDPGTLRYDWFYEDATHSCVALDTYRDAEAMFAHMRNCHAPHAKLLELSTLTTEFLGELSPAAMQAVAKYAPFILSFHRGLKPHSSGGFQ